MVCNKCNSENSNDSKFCSKCGAVIGSNNNSTDENLIKAYIGGNKVEQIYNSVMTSKFNIYAFLFGIFYYVYRKMYLVGFLMILASLFIGAVGEISSTIVNIAMGLAFYPLYKWDINRKIDSIKNTYGSSNDYELIEKVKAKGGTSVGAAVFTLIAYLVLAIVLFM